MSVERKLSLDNSQLTITLDEKFDFGKVQDFRKAYMDEDTDSVKEIVIDLRNTDYMDSSALGMLLNMQKTKGDSVTKFSIVNCKPQVMKILTVSRFDKKFDLS